MLFAEGIGVTEGVSAGALAIAVGIIFRLLVSNYDKQLKSKDDERDRLRADFEKQLTEEKNRTMSWKKIAGNAVALAESSIPADKRVAQLAAVVGEANSPMTEKEKEDAALQTVRARLVAVTLAAGHPARIAETDTGGGLVPLADQPAEPHQVAVIVPPIPKVIEQRLDALSEAVEAVPHKTAEEILKQTENGSPGEKAP